MQFFHSNTSVDNVRHSYLYLHDLCRCPCCLVHSLHLSFLLVAKVAHLVVELGTSDDGLIEADQDVLVHLELVQLFEKVHALVSIF